MVLDEKLERISPLLYTKIKLLLDHNDSWKKIQKFEELYRLIEPPHPLPSPFKSPSEYILAKLTEKLCTMDILRQILLKSELYDVLATFYTEKFKIEKQPTDDIESNENELFIKRKTQFSLEFSVSGIPQLTYQWYKDDEPIADEISSRFICKSYTSEMEGEYYCIAVQKIEDYRTNEITEESVTSNTVTVLTLQERCIIKKMPITEIGRQVGDSDIVLEIIADGFPTPRYQWSRDNQLLSNRTNKHVITTKVDNKGIYRCKISNGINDLIVATMVKIVDPTQNFPVCLEPAKEKVAFLIGNQAYVNQTRLSTPVNDTEALQTKLESIGFLVLNVNNLTLNGMNNAIEYFKRMCCEDCIALFYYAGHGFEFGDKYMMPIDVPDSKNYRLKNSVCENKILKEILDRKPKLLVTLLDMCLTYPKIEDNPGIYEEKREIYQYPCGRNIIRGYSTTNGYSSVEFKRIKHSIYNCILQDYITKKIPILQILRGISKGFEELTSDSLNKVSQQIPYISEHTTKDYYLDVEKTGYPPAKEIVEMLQRSKSRPKPNIQS